MKNLNQPIIEFWQGAYGRHSRPICGGVEFSLPGFPDPLLSPRFPLVAREDFLCRNPGLSYFNEIATGEAVAPAGFCLEMEFLLGAKKTAPYSLPAAVVAEEMSLAQALGINRYWELLTQGFPRHSSFLLSLLPFLAKQASFTVIFLHMRNEVAGVITVGVAGNTALVMNSVVEERFRGRGISRLLAGAASDFSHRTGANIAFFWTEHRFLGPYAEEVSWYRVWRASVG